MPRGNGGGLPVGRRRRPGRPASGAPGTAGPALPAGTRRGIAPMQSSCDQTARQSTPRPPANPGHPTRPLTSNRMGLTVIPGQCPPRRHGDVHRDSSGQPGLTRRTPDLPAPGTGVSQQRSQLNGHTTRDIRRSVRLQHARPSSADARRTECSARRRRHPGQSRRELAWLVPLDQPAGDPAAPDLRCREIGDHGRGHVTGGRGFQPQRAWRSASSSCKFPRRSPPRRSASTTPPPSASAPPSAEPGAGTRPAVRPGRRAGGWQ